MLCLLRLLPVLAIRLLRSRRELLLEKCELIVEALHELRQEGVASIHVGDVCQASKRSSISNPLLDPTFSRKSNVSAHQRKHGHH
jgi:hypothetical protein